MNLTIVKYKWEVKTMWSNGPAILPYKVEEDLAPFYYGYDNHKACPISFIRLRVIKSED